MSAGTERRSVRVDGELWTAALAAAERRGTDLSAVIRRALADLVSEDRALTRARNRAECVGIVDEALRVDWVKLNDAGFPTRIAGD